VEAGEKQVRERGIVERRETTRGQAFGGHMNVERFCKVKTNCEGESVSAKGGRGGRIWLEGLFSDSRKAFKVMLSAEKHQTHLGFLGV